MPDRTDDEIAQLFFHVAKLSRYVSAQDGYLLPFIGQYRCMLFLQKSGPISQKKLAQGLQIRPASLSELLSKLESKQLIQKSADPADSRGRWISLTPAGLQRVEGWEQRRKQFHCDLLSKLSPEEKQQFYQILLKIQSYQDEAAPHGKE